MQIFAVDGKIDTMVEKVEASPFYYTKHHNEGKNFLRVMFNKPFMTMIQGLGYSTVPLVGEYQNLVEAILSNTDWMVNG